MALIQVKNKSARLITVRGKKLIPGGLPAVFDTDKEIGVEKDCEGVTGLIVTPLKSEQSAAPAKAETAKEKKAREAAEKAAALLAASQSQNEPPKDEESTDDENEDEEKEEDEQQSEDKPEGWK